MHIGYSAITDYSLHKEIKHRDRTFISPKYRDITFEIMLGDKAVEKGTQRRLHIAVICREAGGRGSVPTVALRQAQELGRYARVTLLSDSFPDNTDSCLLRHPVTAAN